jgi:hypothetical protein
VPWVACPCTAWACCSSSWRSKRRHATPIGVLRQSLALQPYSANRLLRKLDLDAFIDGHLVGHRAGLLHQPMQLSL